MFFIDAENLVFRYQAMVAEGREPEKGAIHVKDRFVWHPQITKQGMFNVARVYLYTSVVGDDVAIREVKKQIAAVTYHYDYGAGDHEVGTAQIVPVVFKKPARSHKSRQVDISIAIDMMRFAHDASVELLYLVSGDGDYLPLIGEVMRHGKEMYVAALSSGLSEELCVNVDEFVNLDRTFFRPQAKSPTKSKRSSGASASHAV